MIIFFVGEDRERARAKRRELGENLLAKRPETECFYLTSDSFSVERFEELVVGQSLFGQKFIVFGDYWLENNLAPALLADKFAELVQSANTFLFLEGALPIELRRLAEKHQALIHEFKGKNAPDKYSSFNIFRLTESLAARDRRLAWLLFHQALAAGFSAEEIFWKFVWQMKNLLLVKQMGNRPIKILKPFVAEKVRRAASNFSAVELAKLSRSLLELYHRARRGQSEFDLGLEQIILEL